MKRKLFAKRVTGGLTLSDVQEKLQERITVEACRTAQDDAALERVLEDGVGAFVAWFDENTNTGIFEPVDGPALRFILRMVGADLIDRALAACEG